MKKIISVLAVLMVFTFMGLGFRAEGELPYVVDDADLLTNEEESELYFSINPVCAEYNVDIVIVTINEAQGKTSQDYADDYYDYNGYGRDEQKSGVLLLIDMDNRVVHISTTGKCIDAITDYYIECILDAIWDDFTGGKYGDAFTTFVNEVEWYLYQQEHYGTGDIDPDPYVDPYEGYTTEQKFLAGVISSAFGSLGIGGLAGFISTRVMKSKLKSVQKKSGASDYEAENSFNLAEANDIYLYSHTVSHRVESDSNRSSGGGGGSSVHISSSGSSHGGGGRSF